MIYVDEIKAEWQKINEAREKMEGMMKGMDMTGMEEMNVQWEKMTGAIDKLQEMMKKQGW